MTGGSTGKKKKKKKKEKKSRLYIKRLAREVARQNVKPPLNTGGNATLWRLLSSFRRNVQTMLNHFRFFALRPLALKLRKRFVRGRSAVFLATLCPHVATTAIISYSPMQQGVLKVLSQMRGSRLRSLHATFAVIRPNASETRRARLIRYVPIRRMTPTDVTLTRACGPPRNRDTVFLSLRTGTG